MITPTKFTFIAISVLLYTGTTVRAQINMDAALQNGDNNSPTNTYSVKNVALPSGIRLEYVEQGSTSGTPVIFLHGYTDSWQSFNQVLPLLPNSVHAYAVSQRGHGGSDQPKKGYDPGEFALDLAEFMQELEIGSAIIVGHSMGATVAQRFALDYPYMTKALVLAGSFASFKTNPGITELQAIIDNIKDPIDSNFVYEFQKGTSFTQLEPAVLQTYVRESLKVPTHVWKAVARESLNVDYSKELNEVRVPALIIWGDKDSFCPEGDQYILKKAIKRSTLLKYKDVGHAVQWEVPEKFTRDVLQFIDRIK